MASKDNDGCAGSIGVAIFFIIFVVSAIPKEIWIGLGVIAAVGVLMWLAATAIEGVQKVRAEAAKREKAAQAAQAAAEKKLREAAVRKAKQNLIDRIGEKNALLVDSARASVKKVTTSEAARTGWLGDVDFTDDLRGIVENFAKAHDLRKVARKLSALDKPSDDDRKILGEATATAECLEKAAVERVALIGRCAAEAKAVDDSLETERRDARTAEQRAQLHAQLNAMLYGIEAAPPTTPGDSTADAVMARVQAYREIKHQIHQARGSGA